MVYSKFDLRRVSAWNPEHRKACGGQLNSVTGTSLRNGEAPVVPEVDAFFSVTHAAIRAGSSPIVMTRSLAARRMSICAMLH
jgi:hypothetical protein